ncbi:MAG: TPM domain-containing protein [Bacteroidia bacterium]|nr:TPM domain-containing protein [Bacteroidia bacterium]
MKVKLIFIFICIFGAVYSQYPPRPEPFEFVYDFSEEGNFLSQGFRQELSGYLKELERQKSTQLLVVIKTDLGGADATQYATGLLNAWQLGNKGKDNGILMLIKPKKNDEKGEIFIATGYGVEGDLPDIFLGRVIRHTILPRFKEGNYELGVWEGINEIVKKIHPDFKYEKKMKFLYEEQKIGWLEVLIVLILLYVFFQIARRGFGNVIYSGGGRMFEFPYGGSWSRGGGYSGGGFGGFGGRSGGGGAGGSW